MNHLAVVGFGQMGASLAAAWKAGGLRILAIDSDPSVLRKALERGWADEASSAIDDSARADAVLLAVPVRAAAALLPDVVRVMRPDSLLLDVASTKRAVVETYRRAGCGVPYVSLHPLAGNEGTGIDSADPAMFRDAPFLVLSVHASDEVVADLESRIRAIGARPIRMASAREHDAAVAATIHLPHVLAYALAHLGRDHAELAGRSFRDSTRVALSDATMVLDFLLTNVPRTTEAIERLVRLLERFRAMLAAGDEEGLARFVEEAKRIRTRL
ncbi:MAG: prephenate dehydrogenase [Planctomycetes bacterium]|nr:prephenate dehydrogenase [Planctomycetota bacterium]